MKVKLTKEAKLFGYYNCIESNDEFNDWIQIKPDNQYDLMPALSAYIEIEEGFTLRHFFEFIKEYKLENLHKGFTSFMVFYEKYCKNGPIKMDPNYEYLELSRCTMLNRNKVFFQRKLKEKMPKMEFKLKYSTQDMSLSIYDDLNLIVCAYRDDEDGMGCKKGDPIVYSISMLTINKIIDLEIRITPREFQIEKDRERYEDFTNHKIEKFLMDDWHFTLIQFIQIIMESITAWGDTVEENEAHEAYMLDCVDEVKDKEEVYKVLGLDQEED